MSKQRYFLGGTSPEGFKSKFIDLIKDPKYYTYVLKGGPGTGKSTLMKKIAEEFEGCNISVFYCSSDTRSLDAVVIEDKGVIVVDGTAPHVFETIYPAAFQDLINLGDCWNRKEIEKHKDALRYTFDENQKYHARTKCYVEALSSLNDDIYAIGESCLEKKKLSSYIGRLMKKLLPKAEINSDGKLQFRQLSAFTADGYMTMPVGDDYSVYFIKDDLFCGGDFFLRSLADNFTRKGYTVSISECTMLHSFTYEHLIVDELKLAFLTGNFFNKLYLESASIINFARFYDKSSLTDKKQRLLFDKKASLELADEAAVSLSTALDIHDEMEKFYINAINFDMLNEKTEKLIAEIKEK